MNETNLITRADELRARINTIYSLHQEQMDKANIHLANLYQRDIDHYEAEYLRILRWLHGVPTWRDRLHKLLFGY